MKKILSLLTLLVCIFGTQFASADEVNYPGVKGLSDQEIHDKLIGTWVGKEKGFQGKFVYKANGECTTDLVPVDLLVKLVADPYSFSGTWEIKDGLLLSVVSKSNSHSIVPGTQYQNVILKLTDDIFITKNQKGWVSTFTRDKKAAQ